jgi:hypothetical protein
MKVSEVLDKIVYKATIQTYRQNSMSNRGICLQEGYATDLKSSIFTELEVEHIGYDEFRRRVSIMVEEKDCIDLLKSRTTEDIATYLEYHKGYHGLKNNLDEKSIKEKFIYEVKNYGQ